MTEGEKKRFRQVLAAAACASVIVCLTGFLFFRTGTIAKGFRYLISILMPFIYGAVIAYILRPVSLFLERCLKKLEMKLTKQRRPALIRLLSILLSLAILLTVLVLLILAVLPQLISSISGLLAQLPAAVEQFRAWISSLDNGGTSHEIVAYIEQSVDTVTAKLQSYLSSDVLPVLGSLVSSVTSSFQSILALLKNFGLGCIVAAYLLSGWEKFAAQAKLAVYALFPEKTADWIKKEVHYADRMFSGFIIGNLMDSLLVGCICFPVLKIAGVPFAVLVSVVVGVTNIIPFFGPYLGTIPSALLILTVSPGKCIFFVLFMIVLQQIDGNLISPRILGSQMGLSGFWILFSILIAGELWGIAGMLIGAPLFAVIYDLIRTFIFARLHLRQEDELIAAYTAEFGAQEPGREEGRQEERGEEN